MSAQAGCSLDFYGICIANAAVVKGSVFGLCDQMAIHKMLWVYPVVRYTSSLPSLSITRPLPASVVALAESLPRLAVPRGGHVPRNIVIARRCMPLSLCYTVVLSLLFCLTTASTPYENTENWDRLKGAVERPTGDGGVSGQPRQEEGHKVTVHTPGHGVAQGIFEHENWDNAAFQPVHPLAGLEFESMITDSYRGPGNNDTRRNKELPIILWWSENLFPHFPGETERIDCRLSSCLVTKNKKVKLHKRTKSVIFYGTDFRAYEAPLPRLPHQTWALFHEESPMNNYVLSHLPGISLFNYTATFRRESDYPLALQWLPDIGYLQHPAVLLAERNEWRAKHGHAAVLYMQSHCDVPSDRDRYVQELMKYIQIDSYGKCLNNRKLPDERLDDTSTATTEDAAFMSFVSKYKFHLAMENAICPDYMTEKLWRPMHLGAIPIYRGSPSVRDWMPDKHSIILVDDFPSPKALAEFIMSLDADDEAYLHYLEYKKPGGVINQYLLETLEGREWGVNDMTLPNYLNGFECFVCDQENARIAEENTQRKFGGSALTRVRHMAKYNHMGCPMPVPGFGATEHLPENDSWKQMWLQDYWQSMDQGEALASMIRRNETDVGRFWNYMHEIFIRRSMQH